MPDGGNNARNNGPVRVEVLLATRNSTAFLEPMLRSLAGQTHSDFHLIVSDDGSTDGTVGMLESFRSAFRNPVRIIRRTTPSGSAMANFSSLLQVSTGDFVFLADHDDIWLPEKVAAGVAALMHAEAEAGVETPLLYHSDLRVIDADGRVTHPSYWAFKRIDPGAADRLGSALMHPVVTGCAMAMNRALVLRAGPVPAEAVMHDWWLTLVACGFGRVIHDPEPRILYRVHGRNVSRPKQVKVLGSLGQLGRIPALRRGMRRRMAQGLAFAERFGPYLPPPQARQMAEFATLAASWPGLRQYRMIRGGFLGPDPWRNIVQLLLT